MGSGSDTSNGGIRARGRARGRRLSVAHVTATFPPYFAGTGNVCYHNARELARLGHDVRVLTSDRSATQFELSSAVRVRRLRTPFRLGNAPFMPGLLRLRDFDLVHLHVPFIFGAEMTWIACRHRLPYVVTYHMDLSGYGPRRWAFWFYQRLVTPAILGAASAIIVTTMDYARASNVADLLRRHRQRVYELPNGVDVDVFKPLPSGQELRKRYGLTKQDLVVLFVGALDRAHHFKGISVMLRALAKINRNRVVAFIVGDGEDRPSYEQEASRLGLRERTVFCGRVAEEALPHYYSLSDVLVLPSTTMGEAFGLVLLEAMACGKPVVASRLPGVRTVVDDGVDGFLVEPSNVEDLREKLERVLGDPELRRTMGLRGRAKVEQRYAWSRIGEKLEEIYVRALGAHP